MNDGHNPFRVVEYFGLLSQGRPSPNRANPGLNDSILSGLWNGYDVTDDTLRVRNAFPFDRPRRAGFFSGIPNIRAI